ncbi:MAG: polyprenyl synthetase family protein [Infirmifilum sp.]
MMTLTLLRSRIDELRKMLDSYIRENLSSEIPSEDVLYALEGGKRIRGTLALYIADSLAGNPQKALPVALALELMHSASLIHDDIIDRSYLRRGRESFWKKYGINYAVIFPHIMIATAIKYVAKAGANAVVESMEAWRRAAYGQIWDMQILDGIDPGISYMQIISSKTGAVFEAASVLPLYALGYPEARIADARMFGLALGSAYQILDDLADVEKERRDSGSVVKLLQESRGDPISHGVNLFQNEIDKILKSALKLSSSLAFFARYSLELFLLECKPPTRKRISEIISSRWSYWKLPDYQ